MMRQSKRKIKNILKHLTLKISLLIFLETKKNDMDGVAFGIKLRMRTKIKYKHKFDVLPKKVV